MNWGRGSARVQVEGVEEFRTQMEKIFSVGGVTQRNRLAVLMVVLRRVVGIRPEFKGWREEVYREYGEFMADQLLLQ